MNLDEFRQLARHVINDVFAANARNDWSKLTNGVSKRSFPDSLSLNRTSKPLK